MLPLSTVVYAVPPGPAWPQAVLSSSLLKVAQGPRIEFNLGLLHFPHFDLWRRVSGVRLLAFRFSLGAISSANMQGPDGT